MFHFRPRSHPNSVLARRASLAGRASVAGPASGRPLAVLLLLAGAFLPASPAAAQDAPVTLEVRVLTPDGQPADDVRIQVLDLGLSASTDAQGLARFEGVFPGSLLVEAISPTWGRSLERIDLGPDGPGEHVLRLTRSYRGEELLVTVGPNPLRRSEVARASDAVSGRELVAARRATLGETLEGRPGISSSYFGPGSGRPVIRGLSGDRVRVLESGLTSGDASATSPDHAVSTEPWAADRIEILRGPATLLYGSSAVGGVVNVIDGRIPRQLPDRPVTGHVTGGGGTVADETTGAFELDGAVGRIAWHLGGLRRETEDYGIPGFAERDHDEEPGGGATGDGEPFGTLPNSFVETTRGTVGLSYVGNDGYLGVAFGGFDNLYGVPGHGHEEEEAGGDAGGEAVGEEEAVRIDMQQRRLDLEGAWRFRSPWVSTLRVRVGRTDYRHFELEGPEIGTRFENDEWEGRLEAEHRLGDLATGVLGVQLGRRDFLAVGEEAFVPPSETDRIGVFLLEEFGREGLRYQLGARYERQDVASTLDGLELDHAGVSLSGGLVWSPLRRLDLALTASRSTKLPSAEELFSDGPHLATRSFEIGDASLDEEVALGGELSLRLREGRTTGEITGFVTRFEDFIYQAFTGGEEDGLPVLRYTQDAALFTGFEAQGRRSLLAEGPRDLALGVTADHVRAELVDTDEPLPRIPPVRVGGFVEYLDATWRGRLGARRVFEQERTAAFETPTDGYTLVDASVGYRFASGRVVHDVTLTGSNLADREARSHVSFLKELAPLPGREVRLTYRLGF